MIKTILLTKEDFKNKYNPTTEELNELLKGIKRLIKMGGCGDGHVITERFKLDYTLNHYDEK